MWGCQTFSWPPGPYQDPTLTLKDGSVFVYAYGAEKDFPQVWSAEFVLDLDRMEESSVGVTSWRTGRAFLFLPTNHSLSYSSPVEFSLVKYWETY